jgi:hypothetical protein
MVTESYQCDGRISLWFLPLLLLLLLEEADSFAYSSSSQV